ncbi:asparaginase [Ideonella sp. BN130291]|uniref:asparaginase n=1 Tax=Ideonella sp. BN130291 TaxID=3112940 RepID=UPI002E26E470|nr:asparaginase [Ideonella sp. BN130291]
MQNKQRVVILGTGGTIAGRSAQAGDNVGYTAGQIGVDALVAAVPALAGEALEAQQVAQLDSKDMDHATWLLLAQHLAYQLARPEVQGVVITHGTDTLEETAYFLHRLLAPPKPVVLTAAMRPATALLADGPQNLLDAVRVARCAGARGVVTVLNGQVLAAEDVRKVHSYRVEAFSAGDAGPLAVMEEGRLRLFRDWPQGQALGLAWLPSDVARWPRVEVLLSHAGASGGLVEALVAQGVRGIVVAGTGNGTVHRDMQAALQRAQLAGVRVLRSSRCVNGAVVGDGLLDSAGALPPVKARIELMLQLMAPSAA